MKNKDGELASSNGVDTAAPLTDEELDTPTHNVNGDAEDKEENEQEDITKEAEQDNGQSEADGSTEDIKTSGLPDDKKEESEVSSIRDEEEGEGRSRKKIHVETAESLSLPVLPSKQTPGNGLTYKTPVAKDDEANGASPSKHQGLIKSPSVQKLAAKFEIAPPPTQIKKSTRGNRSKLTPEKESPAKKLKYPGKHAQTPTAIKTKRKGQLTIEDSLNAGKSSTKKPPGKKQRPSRPSKMVPPKPRLATFDP